MSPCGNIVLVGLSGAGKTSCAQILAELLDLAVLDTDVIIQKNTSMSVAAIFAQQGEVYFRALERQLIEDFIEANLAGTVLSVGGGLPAQGDNVHLLKKLGLTVFLNASPETLARRLSQDVNRDHSLRPLLARPGTDKDDCKEESQGVKENNLEAALSDQLARRRKYYEEAHLVINTDGKYMQDICLEIQTIIVNNAC